MTLECSFQERTALLHLHIKKIFCYLRINQAYDHLPRKFVNSKIVIIMCTVDSFVSSPKPPYFVLRKTFMYNVSDLIIIFDTPNI